MPHIGYFPVPAFPKPLVIGHPNVLPMDDTEDWSCSEPFLRKNAILAGTAYYAPVILPQGARVTKLTLYAFRDDALATLELTMKRVDNVGTVVIMATVNATWTDGAGSGYDDSIDDDVIDNENYSYLLRLVLTPNDSVTDVRFYRGVIDWQ